MNIPHDELLVLDWILCAQGEAIILQKREELMRWRELRERVWRGILSSELSGETALIELEPIECEELLAMVPTSRPATSRSTVVSRSSRESLAIDR